MIVPLDAWHTATKREVLPCLARLEARDHDGVVTFEPELLALAERALVRPMPDLGTLAVTGPDRLSWLAGMVTGDVRGLTPGAAVRTLVVGTTGRILADVWLLIAEDRVLLGLSRALVESVRTHLEEHLVMEDAELAVDEAPVWWSAYGPHAGRVEEEAARLGAAAGHGDLAGLAFSVMAIPRGASRNLAEALTAPTGALLATPEGFARARIERLLPELGVDFEVGAYPQEARLERFAVSFNKGCYVGQEAVFMLEKRGHPPRRLVRLRVRGRTDVARGAEVHASDGSSVGAVTTAVVDAGDTWALAMVRYKQSLVGTELRIAGAVAELEEPGG